MGRHIIGLADPTRTPPWPLDSAPRFIFSDWYVHMDGYRRLFGPALAVLAARSGGEIFGLNDLLILRDADLDAASSLLAHLKCDLGGRPASWHEYIGECIHAGGQREILNPLLLRGRALNIVDQLARMIEQARRDRKLFLYGNGAAFRVLDGKLLSPTTETYS